jgi:hypothetical protein
VRGDSAGSPGASPSPAPRVPSPPPVARTAPVEPSKASPAPVPAPGPAIAGTNTDLQALWPKLLEGIGRASPFARSYFIEAHPVSFVNNVLTIGFDPEFADHIGMVDNAKNHALIATKLSELGHPNAQVKIIKAERPDGFVSSAPPPAPEPESPAPSKPSVPGNRPAAPAPPAAPTAKPVQLDPTEFKNDPLIKKALEVFKGTIVEVRA